MQDLKPIIEQELEENGFHTELENVAEWELTFKVKRTGYTSRINLERTRHRPLQLEVTADYNYYNYQKNQATKNKKRNQNRNSQTPFYYRYWPLFFFLGLILTVLTFAANLFVSFVNVLTPGWTSAQRGIGVAAVILVIVLFWIFVVPILRNRLNSNNAVIDKEVLAILENKLQEVNKEMIGTETVKCWNCFTELKLGQMTCPKCGSDQS